MSAVSKASLLLLLLVTAFTGPVVNADINRSYSSVLLKQIEIKEGTQGKLDGQMVPYIQELPFTGTQTLHYKVKNTNFVKGDIASLLLQLPEEFAQITHVPNFLTYISGNISYSSILGHETVQLSPEIMEVSNNRVIIHLPDKFWKGEVNELDEGTVSLNFVVNYGEILYEYPSVTISNAAIGYTFQAKLKYSAQEWNDKTEPLNATIEETYITPETSAIKK